MQSANPNYLKGALFGLAAVSIWAGWSAMTRLAVTTGLDAWDIPALRFGVAGLLLLPIIARRGLALGRLGWIGLGGLIVGTGAPYALVVGPGAALCSRLWCRCAQSRVYASFRRLDRCDGFGREAVKSTKNWLIPDTVWGADHYRLARYGVALHNLPP